MGARAVYFKDKSFPMIKDLLKKEGIIITDDNIKSWGRDVMKMTDVVIGCNYVKSETNTPVVVYTNKVLNLDHLEKSENVKIFDSEKLKELSLKYRNYELYDILS